MTNRTDTIIPVVSDGANERRRVGHQILQTQRDCARQILPRMRFVERNEIEQQAVVLPIRQHKVDRDGDELRLRGARPSVRRDGEKVDASEQLASPLYDELVHEWQQRVGDSFAARQFLLLRHRDERRQIRVLAASERQAFVNLEADERELAHQLRRRDVAVVGAPSLRTREHALALPELLQLLLDNFLRCLVGVHKQRRMAFRIELRHRRFVKLTSHVST